MPRKKLQLLSFLKLSCPSGIFLWLPLRLDAQRFVFRADESHAKARLDRI